MAALYDPKDSPFLIGAAARLNSQDTARDAYARVAERLLGLTAPAFSNADDAQLAKDAVAMQVSHMIAAGSEVFIAKSESRGQRSVTYRDDVTVNPMARELADGLNQSNNREITTGEFAPGNWATVTSVRPTQPVGLSFESVLQDVRL